MRGEPQLGLLILAGGRSRRMGADKAARPFPDPGDPALVVRVALAVSEIAGPPLIAGRSDYGTGWRRVPDEPGFEGPVAGLLAGLAVSEKPWVLALGADLPFPSPRLVQGLAEIAAREPLAEAVVPERDGRSEPLFALYRPGAVAGLRERARQLASPGHGASLRRTLLGIDVRWVPEATWRAWDPEGLSFLNCNTPEELGRAAARARTAGDQGGIR